MVQYDIQIFKYSNNISVLWDSVYLFNFSYKLSGLYIYGTVSRDFAEIFRPMRFVYLKCEFHGDLIDLKKKNQMRLFSKCL